MPDARMTRVSRSRVRGATVGHRRPAGGSVARTARHRVRGVRPWHLLYALTLVLAVVSGGLRADSSPWSLPLFAATVIVGAIAESVKRADRRRRSRG